MGTLGDHFGRKRLLQSGLAVFAAGSILAALAQNSGELIVLRALMGIGGAMIMPATLSTVSNIFPREERGKAIAIWSAVACDRDRTRTVRRRPAAPVLLLELGLLAERADRGRRASRRGGARPRDARPEAGQARPAGRPALRRCARRARLRDHRSPGQGLDEPGHRRLPRRSRLCSAHSSRGGRFAVRSRCSSSYFFRRPGFSVASLGISLTYFGLMGAIFAFTQYLQFARGFSALAAGAIMLPLIIGLVAGGGNSDHFVASFGHATRDHRGPRRAGRRPADRAALDADSRRSGCCA